MALTVAQAFAEIARLNAFMDALQAMPDAHPLEAALWALHHRTNAAARKAQADLWAGTMLHERALREAAE